LRGKIRGFEHVKFFDGIEPFRAEMNSNFAQTIGAAGAYRP
jgi:hypothetical protein